MSSRTRKKKEGEKEGVQRNITTVDKRKGKEGEAKKGATIVNAHWPSSFLVGEKERKEKKKK